jgi:hypothetical protein
MQGNATMVLKGCHPELVSGSSLIDAETSSA